MIAANCKIPGLRPGSGDATAVGAAGWLSFAATPTFGIMALLTGVFGRAPDMLCSAEHGGSPLAGMGAMYALMSVLHSAPWVNLLPKGPPAPEALVVHLLWALALYCFR